jgi:hypothetical protein
MGRCHGRAAGVWWKRGEGLALLGFAASGLEESVSEAFTRATGLVELERTDLGVVRAAIGEGPAVSRVAALADEAGSGHWLRAFGAAASVAVGIRARPGAEAIGVVSIALADDPDEDRLRFVLRCLADAAEALIADLSGPSLA